jgi:hypothetical protein
MAELNRGSDPQLDDARWTLLYKLGGWAALFAALVFRRNLAEEFLFFRSLGIIRSGPRSFPTDAAGCFTLLHAHRLIGLTFLNLFDTVNYALVGLIFLAVCAALFRVNKGAATLATALTFVSVAVYFASNQAFPMLSLSDQYAVATSDAQRSALLAAGQALLAIHNSSANYGDGLYPSFLLVNLAGLLIATTMLRSRAFGRASAITGILANVFGLGYYVTLVLGPRLSVIPISAGAVFLLMWYLLMARRLLQLGRSVLTN